MDNNHELWSKMGLVVCILLGFALRMYHLGQQPLSWDEGWSIGLSSLDWCAIQRITALDVHPPLYYDLFKLWLGLGRHELLLRFLSVMAGMATVPLAYVTGRAWMHSPNAREHAAHVERGGEQVGLAAAFLTAIAPFLVYYAQVARMYALSATLSLLATYLLLRAMDTGKGRLYLAFVLSATVAVYTFYYTALVIAAACIYALFQQPRRWPALLLSTAAIVVLYTPWLSYAVPPMLTRIGSRSGFAFRMTDALQFLRDGLFGLAFAYGAGWIAVYVIVGLLAVGLVLAWRNREPMRGLALPVLAIVLTLLTVSVGAKAHMFAARYLIPASPFLALLLAWAFAVCWRHPSPSQFPPPPLHCRDLLRSPGRTPQSDKGETGQAVRAGWLGILGLLALVISVLPTLTHYVYAKAYEVSGAFDPQADYRYLQDKTFPDDIVFFNVLSLAGLYERFRSAADPRWSYALRWDPVIEPLEAALTERVQPAIGQHRRLWFVLYKGTVGANLALKEWLDLNLYPAFGVWREDTLYMQYLSPTPHMAHLNAQLSFNKGIVLRAVLFTPRTQADDRVIVRLTWTATESIKENYKVFVHLYTMDGRLVTQHDAVPVNELRPTWSWQPGEEITDNHGLWVPADISGTLQLVVGLYDPTDNARLTLPDGSDHAVIGTVEVTARASE